MVRYKIKHKPTGRFLTNEMSLVEIFINAYGPEWLDDRDNTMRGLICSCVLSNFKEARSLANREFAELLTKTMNEISNADEWEIVLLTE